VASIITDIISAPCLLEPFDLVLRMGTMLQFMVFSKLDNLRYSFPDSVLFSEILSVNVALIAMFLSSHFAH
jgi:hypothetical protein